MTRHIDFYFDFSSPYSYLSMARAEQLLAGLPIELRFKPIVLGAIFQRLGWESSPFLAQPRKLEYMWMDVARQAERYGIEFHQPGHFPVNSVLAARVATFASEQPWLQQFCKAAFEAYMINGEDIGQPDIVARILNRLELDSKAILALAAGADNKARLRQVTEQADQLGLFGAPTFVVDGQLFWGDDRFETALDSCIRDSAKTPSK